MPNQLPQNSSFVSSFNDQPVLVAEDRSAYFATLLQELAVDEDFKALYAEPSAMDTGDDDEEFWSTGSRPYNVKNGILQIPVWGVLLNRFSHQYGRWATGYQYIERAFNRGMDDPQVNGIAFHVDSPGGVVAGNFELVEKMVARRGEKPVRAFAADHAYSAAYSISTAADEIVVTRSGGVGSVGVVVMHIEMSEMLKDWGVKVTFIYAGKHKVEGNSYEKLSDGAKARIQTRVDRIYGEFVGLVADNRDMEEEAVRDTEALTYDATDALEVGFADRVGSFEEELAVFEEEADSTENEFMTTKTQKTTPAPAAANDGQITQEMLDAAVADAKAEGVAEGAEAERARMTEIMESEEAKTRPAAAKALVEAGMDAETAKATLKKMPEEATTAPKTEAAPDGDDEPKPAPKGKSGFDKAMANSDNPDVGDDDGGGSDDDEKADSNALLNSLAMARGRPRKQTMKTVN